MTSKTQVDPGRELFDHVRDSYESRARRAIDALRAILAVAEERLDSAPGTIERQCLTQSANRAADEAKLLHEAASALDALEHVARAIQPPVTQ